MNYKQIAEHGGPERMKLKRMVGRLDEQMRRGHADLPVIVADGPKGGREIQDVRVVFKDGAPIAIYLYTEVNMEHAY